MRADASLDHLCFDMLIAESLTKVYRSGDRPLTVLHDVSFRVDAGEFVAIVGPSGSGKTTLLGLLAGLDTPSHGRVILDGADLSTMDENSRARLRGDKVGFVFQSFQLIPTLTALENVQVPLELRASRWGNGGARGGERGTTHAASRDMSSSTDRAADRAAELLARVGLAERLDHLPTQLSGGEQQRVAIARAFVNEPRILFADEPTGNLDAASGARVVELLEALNRSSGSTVILVTHDSTLAQHASRVIRVADGAVVSDTRTQPTA